MDNVKRKKGYRFDGPDGQYYILTRDVQIGEVILPTDFEPHGGAPKPKATTEIPLWLVAHLHG